MRNNFLTDLVLMDSLPSQLEFSGGYSIFVQDTWSSDKGTFAQSNPICQTGLLANSGMISYM